MVGLGLVAFALGRWLGFGLEEATQRVEVRRDRVPLVRDEHAREDGAELAAGVAGLVVGGLLFCTHVNTSTYVFHALAWNGA
jgi:hypothetical protein